MFENWKQKQQPNRIPTMEFKYSFGSQEIQCCYRNKSKVIHNSKMYSFSSTHQCRYTGASAVCAFEQEHR